MLKKLAKKIIGSVVTLLLVGGAVGGVSYWLLTKDNAPNRQIKDEHFKYINDYTFSIAAIDLDTDKATLGTMWAYAKITNYEYVFITNYHVYESIEALGTSGHQRCLGILTTNYNDGKKVKSSMDDYITFASGYDINSFDVVKEDWGLMSSPMYQDQKETYMDVVGIKINLQEAYNNAQEGKTKFATDFSSKVNILNQAYSNNKIILNISSNPAGSIGKKVYMAGYPWATSNNEDRDYTYFCEWYDTIQETYTDRSNCLNVFGDTDYYTYQYQSYLPAYKKIPMGGGASGSMVIDDEKNIVGIYWGGGYSIKDSKFFYPSFAYFSCELEGTTHDIISDINTNFNLVQ